MRDRREGAKNCLVIEKILQEVVRANQMERLIETILRIKKTLIIQTPVTIIRSYSYYHWKNLA